MDRPNHLYDKDRFLLPYLFAVGLMSVDVWFHVSHSIANFILRFVVQLLVFFPLFLATLVHHVGFSLLPTYDTNFIQVAYESIVFNPSTLASAWSLISLLQHTPIGPGKLNLQRDNRPL